MRPENEPTGKPRSFIEEARRRQIIASAAEVLADEGFGRATLARIARHAGISKGVISYYFAGKDELMSEVVVQLFTSGAEFMGPRIAAEPTAVGQLRAYITSNLEFLDANRRYVAAMIEVILNLRNADGTPTFTADQGDDGSTGPLAELLEAGQKSGEFGEFDAWTMAMLIRDSVDGASTRASRDPSLDMTAYAEQMISIYLHAVQPAPTRADSASETP